MVAKELRRIYFLFSLVLFLRLLCFFVAIPLVAMMAHRDLDAKLCYAAG
jgi:hypothetical protein